MNKIVAQLFKDWLGNLSEEDYNALLNAYDLTDDDITIFFAIGHAYF